MICEDGLENSVTDRRCKWKWTGFDGEVKCSFWIRIVIDRIILFRKDTGRMLTYVKQKTGLD